MMPLCGSGVSAVMRALQGLAVERGKVPGLVDGHNRQAGRHGIQLVARGMPVLRQLGIVIAKAKCHLQLARIGRGGDVLPQRVLQLGNTGIGPIGRRQQVGRNRLQSHPAQVAVRIHKAGDQGAPLQVHHLRGGALPAGHLVTAPQRPSATIRPACTAMASTWGWASFMVRMGPPQYSSCAPPGGIAALGAPGVLHPVRPKAPRPVVAAKAAANCLRNMAIVYSLLCRLVV